ncbi:Pre-mRNA-splicing factor of RES complex-domain-containing protein [Xylariaceae sp. FL0016]|nr:Pre-mRNA-splicing factor of RES complex-domain-containing protein [Xylariaceae sp. FL0016]
MPSDLSSYLATNYLVADPAPSKSSKKRKRKGADAATSGLIIAEDDDSNWSRAHTAADDDDTPTMVAGTSAEFRRAKKSSWKVLGGGPASTSQATPSGSTNPDPSSADADADMVLATAAADRADAGGNDDPDEAPVMMSDGTHAGLQTGAAISAQIAARQRRERAELEGQMARDQGAETIYRDATGRRVDVSMKRAELRREAEEAERKRAQAEEDMKGEVQRAEAARRRERLEDAKTMSLARHADDEEMNAEMRAKSRWGDTMVDIVGNKAVGKKGVKGRPIYKGAWAPNRYGIRPGYRWDGVDRSNGFEAERFKAINRRERNKGLEYSWQMDE